MGVYVDNTGVYVCGWTYGSLPGQTGSGADAFIVKYSLDGEMIWLHQFTCSPGVTCYQITGDESGLYISGLTPGTFPGETNSGAADAFVVKYNRDGNQLWVKQFGTTGDEYPTGISANASGVYVSGYTTGAFPGYTKTGTRNIFVAKLNKDGEKLWVTQIGSVPRPGQTAPTSDYSYYISTVSSYAYVSGYTNGVLPGQTTNGNTDAFLIKLLVNIPPVADCGDAQLDIITETVQLDGSGSSDSDGDDLNYQWSILSKPGSSNSALSSATAEDPTFVADVTGTYEIQLVVNDGTVDSDPCTVTITVITPQEATQNLIDDVQDLVTAGVLNQGQGNALKVKLQTAIQKMNQENYNAAINNLNAFINQVNAFRSAGILTQAQADALITPANRIIAVLNNMLLKSGAVDPALTSDLITWNVPNPFSASTTIWYSLPEELYVTLKVYDSRGKEISVLVDGSITEGTHSVTLSAEGLPSGVYFYRIQAGSYMTTKKLIIVR
jgi:hypothetical protein